MAHRWLLVLGLTVGGCFGAKSARPTTTPPAPAPAPAKPKIDHLAVAVADPLGFLPIDSELVIHLDAERLRRSAIWRQYEPAIVSAASATLQKVKDTCGVDPIAQIKSMRLGASGFGDGGKPHGVMVLTGLDGERLLACSKTATKHSPGITIDGNIVLGAGSDGHPFALEVVDRHAIVGVFGPGVDRAALDAVVNAGSPLRRSPAFTEIFGTINTQSALWFLMNGTSKAFDKARSSGFGFSSMFGSVGLVDGLSASMRIRVDSPSAASTMASQLSQQAGIVSSFIDRLDISADANDVVLELGMSDAQLTSIVGLLGGALGFNASTPAPPLVPTP